MAWPKRRGSKFGAVKTVYQGRTYDSKFEASVARDLDALLATGEIISIVPQRTFYLEVNGKLVGTHKVDFFVTLASGRQKIVEAKGRSTSDFVLRRKLTMALYPEIEYEVVMAKTKSPWRRRR